MSTPTLGAKKDVTATIKISWLLYDIMNETFLRGRTIQNKDNHKEVASMFASEDEENREKILRGMVKACEKRPVSMEQLDMAADDIIAELHRDHQREVPSSIIGMKVIEKLQTIDPVAYIRYVSVYRQFQNVDEFIDLIRRMERTSRIFNDPLQRTLSLN